MPRKDAPSSQTENSIFAQRLRQTMEQMKMTQVDLAKEIGVQRQTVSLYTLGQSSPDAERLILIANALKTTPNYLLGFTEDPDIQPCAADELGLSPMSIDEFRRIKEAGLSDMLNYFVHEGEYTGSLMGILSCFAEILDAHRNQKYLSLREMTGIPDSCDHPFGYLRVVTDAEEKIKKEIDVKSVRVLIENDLQDYLKYRAHLWLDEQIRFMIQDDPKKGTV